MITATITNQPWYNIGVSSSSVHYSQGSTDITYFLWIFLMFWIVFSSRQEYRIWACPCPFLWDRFHAWFGRGIWSRELVTYHHIKLFQTLSSAIWLLRSLAGRSPHEIICQQWMNTFLMPAINTTMWYVVVVQNNKQAISPQFNIRSPSHKILLYFYKIGGRFWNQFLRFITKLQAMYTGRVRNFAGRLENEI